VCIVRVVRIRFKLEGLVGLGSKAARQHRLDRGSSGHWPREQPQPSREGFPSRGPDKLND